MKITSYRDLIVWQKSISLVLDIYKVTEKFPKSEKFGLSSQIKRSVISIPSNIAEGRSRSSRKDFAQFLHIALGSLAEVGTQLEIAKELSFIDAVSYNRITSLSIEISKMLHTILSKLKAGS